MKLLQKWLEKRIQEQEEQREHITTLINELKDNDDPLYDRYMDRMICKGSKRKAFNEVLDYVNTHEDTR